MHSPFCTFSHRTAGIAPACVFFYAYVPRARHRIFSTALQCALSITALFPLLCHIRCPGIHVIALYHDSFLRSCLFESGRAQNRPDSETEPWLEDRRGERSSPCLSRVVIAEAQPEGVDSGGAYSRRDYIVFSKAYLVSKTLFDTFQGWYFLARVCLSR